MKKIKRFKKAIKTETDAQVLRNMLIALVDYQGNITDEEVSLWFEHGFDDDNDTGDEKVYSFKEFYKKYGRRK